MEQDEERDKLDAEIKDAIVNLNGGMELCVVAAPNETLAHEVVELINSWPVPKPNRIEAKVFVGIMLRKPNQRRD